jgi:hypothetical protein
VLCIQKQGVSIEMLEHLHLRTVEDGGDGGPDKTLILHAKSRVNADVRLAREVFK